MEILINKLNDYINDLLIKRDNIYNETEVFINNKNKTMENLNKLNNYVVRNQCSHEVSEVKNVKSDNNLNLEMKSKFEIIGAASEMKKLNDNKVISVKSKNEEESIKINATADILENDDTIINKISTNKINSAGCFADFFAHRSTLFFCFETSCGGKATW